MSCPEIEGTTICQLNVWNSICTSGIKFNDMNGPKLIWAALFAAYMMAACTHKAHPHGMPPGQAKKISGSKSAKPFAPGQQKKNY